MKQTSYEYLKCYWMIASWLALVYILDIKENTWIYFRLTRRYIKEKNRYSEKSAHYTQLIVVQLNYNFRQIVLDVPLTVFYNINHYVDFHD